jgi:hypothetical protein
MSRRPFCVFTAEHEPQLQCVLRPEPRLGDRLVCLAVGVERFRQ